MPKGIIVLCQPGFAKLRDEQGQERMFSIQQVVSGTTLAEGMPVEFELQRGAVFRVQSLPADVLIDVPPIAARPAPIAPSRTASGNHPMPTIKPPYHFIPVILEQGAPVTDQPVMHDGANGAEQARLLSGELRLSFKALTPLLAANDQYEAWEVVRDQEPGNDATVSLPQGWGIPFPVKAKKKILEPLRLPDPDGRVLIPGSQLKGMLRHELGALLLAPMERVAERIYFHMPNRNFGANLATKPAVLWGAAAGGGLDVRIPPAIGNWDGVIFVEEQARNDIAAALPPGTTLGPGTYIPMATRVKEVRLDEKPQGGMQIKKLLAGPRGNVWPVDRNYYYCDYASGIDGEGLLSQKFGRRGRYIGALVAADNWRAATIQREVVLHYGRTLDGIRDKLHGHISPRHPLHLDKPDIQRVQDAIDGCRARVITTPTQYQLLYILTESAPPNTILTFGHHFRFRTRYADTIRKQHIGYAPNGQETTRVREILLPLDEELTPLRPNEPASPPRKLSGARLIFGYAVDDESADSGTCDIGASITGRSDFKRLAGRLAFNMALEQLTNNATLQQRFLGANPDFIVPLKPLGQPRASAPETNLQQPWTAISARPDNGGMLTLGDRILSPRDQPGELAGRRGYLNQPDAATDPTCYREDDFTILNQDAQAKHDFLQRLFPDGLAGHALMQLHQLAPERLATLMIPSINQARELINRLLRNKEQRQGQLDPERYVSIKKFLDRVEHLHGDQASLGRFVLDQGAQFRVTLRFQDLRPWELGAVLFALEPARACDYLRQNNRQNNQLPNELRQYLNQWGPRVSTDSPRFAHKLGHGRPLGLGSVVFSIDSLRYWGSSQPMTVNGGTPVWAENELLDDVTESQWDGAITAFWNRYLGPHVGAPVEAARKKVLLQWLKIRQYAGRSRSDYPRAGLGEDIFTFHTEVRNDHTRRFRSASSGNRQPAQGILSELP